MSLITSKQLELLRQEFRAYLKETHPTWSENIISMHYSNAFYAYNNDIGIDFWSCFTSDETLRIAKDKIKEYIESKTSPTHAAEKANGYYVSMQYFKSFLDLKYPGLASEYSGKTVKSSAMDLHSLFTQVMNNYLSAKNQAFADNPIANLIRNNFREEIYKTGFITPDKFVVTGSPGQGNWASVPWIGIFSKSITTSATKGVYIVYLFTSDCESVYITLNQGCTELRQTLGKAKAVEEMRKVAEQIVATIDSRGFSTSDHIDLKDNRDLPYLYERGTIFYKEYKKGQLPSNDVLVSDLRKMVDIYNEYVTRIQESSTLTENNEDNEENDYIENNGNNEIINESGIRYYGTVIRTYICRRKDIPIPITRDNPNELYYRFDVKSWEKLPVPIKVCEEGVIRPKFTNMFLFQNCRDSYELFNIHSEEQYRLLQELKRISSDTAVNNDEHKPGFRLNDKISINLLNGDIVVCTSTGKIINKTPVAEFIRRPRHTFNKIKEDINIISL